MRGEGEEKKEAEQEKWHFIAGNEFDSQSIVTVSLLLLATVFSMSRQK